MRTASPPCSPPTGISSTTSPRTRLRRISELGSSQKSSAVRSFAVVALIALALAFPLARVVGLATIGHAEEIWRV